MFMSKLEKTVEILTKLLLKGILTYDFLTYRTEVQQVRHDLLQLNCYENFNELSRISLDS